MADAKGSSSVRDKETMKGANFLSNDVKTYIRAYQTKVHVPAAGGSSAEFDSTSTGESVTFRLFGFDTKFESSSWSESTGMASSKLISRPVAV
jgi:hypothetical protein